jgi:hypothetical protein
LAGTCFRRSAANATQLPIKIRANVALKLPGAMQLMQLPMIVGASNMMRLSFCLSSKWAAKRRSQSTILHPGKAVSDHF